VKVVASSGITTVEQTFTIRVINPCVKDSKNTAPLKKLVNG